MNQRYDVTYISNLVSGKLFGNKVNTFDDIIIDSRSASFNSQSLFVAIVGTNNDGHAFIYNLYEKGVRSFIISKEDSIHKELKDATFILVPNTLFALQKIAENHRKRFHYPLIAITGSNGKTIVKEWLFQLLCNDFLIAKSPRSYNSQIGVPLSIMTMQEKHTLAIMEAGISLNGEMRNLEKMLLPDTVLFTNIGEAHAANFLSTEQKLSEKLILAKHCKKLIIGIDHPIIKLQIEKLKKNRHELLIFTWGKESKANLCIKDIVKNNYSTDIYAIYNQREVKIAIPFLDDASVENAISCWAYLLSENYDNEIIIQRMKLLTPVEMRMEMKSGINNCTIINDSYNSDLASLRVALNFLKQHSHGKKISLFLSDILQTGKTSDAIYLELKQILNELDFNKIYLIGKQFSDHANLFKGNVFFYENTASCLEKLRTEDFLNEFILIKGARTFQLEQISNFLSLKLHKTSLKINLNAVAHNFNVYRKIVPSNTKIMVMVKAFAYGGGSNQIASVLQHIKADYLAVAYTDEGIELRKSGITLPIMVMNPDSESFEKLFEYHLEPQIYSIRILKSLIDFVSSNKNKNQLFAIHIKIDTGMHRLGLDTEDINTTISLIKPNSQIIIKSILSHLAASENPEFDDFTIEQIRLFEHAVSLMEQSFDYPIIKHILNSEGIARFRNYAFDMVRLGIGLYGISGNKELKSGLMNVLELKTVISQIKHIKIGESVGYGRSEIAKKPLTIATIAIGYADGFNRKLGLRKGYVWVKNKKAEVVGNVCMDMSMIDITDIDAREGDEVVIFDSTYGITNFAELQQTIPYEILTGISPRVKRIYLQE